MTNCPFSIKRRSCCPWSVYSDKSGTVAVFINLKMLNCCVPCATQDIQFIQTLVNLANVSTVYHRLLDPSLSVLSETQTKPVSPCIPSHSVIDFFWSTLSTICTNLAKRESSGNLGGIYSLCSHAHKQRSSDELDR